MEKDKLFSLNTLLLIIIGIAVNYFGAKLALLLSLPVFLDAIGTILAAALGGFLPGIFVGFFSNCLNSFSDPITLYYGLVSILIALAATCFSRARMFRSFGKTLLTVPAFALIGGGVGSLMTWMLYGLNIGEGISAPLALTLYAGGDGLPKFVAQLLADLGIDLLDKLAVLLIVYAVLRLCPDGLTARFPLGAIYARGAQPDETQPGALNPRAYRHFSLRGKVANMIIVTCVVLSALAVSISYALYQYAMNARFAQQGEAATALMCEELDGDQIYGWLTGTGDAEEYQTVVQRFGEIRDSMPNIKYMYVYRILEDGCHVVFDLDTPETPGAEPGTVVAFDEDFRERLPKLLNGEEIDPIISSGQYGWLLTVYRPIYNSEHRCAAYAATDIDMQDVVSDRYVFVIRMVSLLFGASMLIAAFALWYAQRKLVEPINALAAAASRFAYDSEARRKENTNQLQRLEIKTGDEIENLYNAISKTTSDVSQYIHLIAVKNADIEQLQDNIILSFADMVENRDENTGDHVRRTAEYVFAIGCSLCRSPEYAGKLTPEYLEQLAKSAPLHDIGKIKIPDAILNKPGRLTPAEFEIIKTHTTAGGEILREALEGVEEASYIREAISMTTCHHERWDGSGYPCGLKGDEIPLGARVMSIADVFDALISKRSYKEAFAFDDAVELIRQGAGTQFDPVCVDAFLRILDEIRQISHN